MGDSFRDSTGISIYRVHLLGDPEISDAGISHREAGHRALLPWDRVEHAMAAEVGEPQGVRTIVFDLVVRDADGWVAYRLDGDPGEEAMYLAQAIEKHLRSGCSSASLKSLATDGLPTRWYPDLDGFEEEAIRLLGGCD